MKSKFGMLAAAGLWLVVSHSASASVIFGFDAAGDNGGWNVAGGVREVPAPTGANSRGLLLGKNVTNDPNVNYNETTSGSIALGVDETWSTLEVTMREVTSTGTTVPFSGDFTGLLAIFNAQAGTPATNFGAPPAPSAADADGFYTFTWDISGFTDASVGNVRIDPVGGPDSNGNTFQIDSIAFNTVPEPASLALIGLGGIAMLGRRRK